MNNCPRCAKLMEESQVDNVAVQFCRACKGLLLAHADLTQILEASWRAVPVAEAEQHTWTRPENVAPDRELSCPVCRLRMEKYGYLGLAAVMIDRCDRCNRVWLGAEELPKMVQALAQSNYREEESRQREQQSLDLTAAAVIAAAPSRVDPDAVRSGKSFWLFGPSPARVLLDLFLS